MVHIRLPECACICMYMYMYMYMYNNILYNVMHYMYVLASTCNIDDHYHIHLCEHGFI